MRWVLKSTSSRTASYKAPGRSGMARPTPKRVRYRICGGCDEQITTHRNLPDLPPESAVAQPERVHPQGLSLEQLVSLQDRGGSRRTENHLVVLELSLVAMLFVIYGLGFLQGYRRSGR